MKIKDYRGQTYTIREAIKAEILSSSYGESQEAMLRNDIDRLADYVATLVQILADQKILDESTVLNMCGYGSSFVEELEKDKTNAS